MSRNNKNRTRNTNTTTNTVVETPVTTEENPVPATHEVVEDNLTQKNDDVSETVQTDEVEQVEEVVIETAEEEPVVELDSALAVEEPVSEEGKLVKEFNEKLAGFKVLLEGFGTRPEDFKACAKKASEVTKFVMKYPTTPVLDALLAFFVENKEGVAGGTTIMKGSTTLPANDERAVGVLFNLFYELANRRVGSINPGFVNSVLKKPEIVTYYKRRKTGIQADRA